MPDIAVSGLDPTQRSINDAQKGKSQTEEQDANSTTFNRSVQISLMEPVGSMSLSPANRDVVLASRKGLFIIDLENPYDQPRFLPHLTTWVPADVQWNPHPARANWVASTSNNKLLVWNLDRPVAMRNDPSLSMASIISVAGSSPSIRSTGQSGVPVLSPSTISSTLPFPHHHHHADILGSTSRLSSISHVLHAHTRAITDINWSPFHPDVLASCGIDTWTWAWDLRDPNKPKQGYSAWNAAMTQVKWNRATQHRLATSCDNKVLIWDDRKGTLPLATIEAHETKIYGVDWSRDKSAGMSRLVTCSLDGSVKWWDLDSPAAQHAIANRQLVTEAETTIITDTPVWRARHLPFGQGVMSLPQRGDTSLSMWSKSEVDEPVHKFKGHKDVVKEYLFRTRGGEDPSSDQRNFQLITWSKDQTLRLWPITDEMLSSVGHIRGAPINVRQTRLNAPNVSYRNPPIAREEGTLVNSFQTATGTPVEGQSTLLSVSPAKASGAMQASPLSQGSAGHLSPDNVSTSMGPPLDATRSLLSGSAKGSTSIHSNGSGSVLVASPQSTLGAIDKEATVGESKSLRKIDTLNQSTPSVRRKMSMTQMAVRDSHRRKVGTSQIDTSIQSRLRDADLKSSNKFGSAGRQSIKTISTNASIGRGEHTVSWMGSNETIDRKGRGYNSSFNKLRKQNEKKLSKTNPLRVMSKQAASQSFMTRGSMTRSGHLNITGAAQKGNASHADAVGWIAGVRMGKVARSPSVSASDRKTERSVMGSKLLNVDQGQKNTGISPLALDEDRNAKCKEDEEDRKDAAQIISEEIMTISKTLSNVTFEKIDVSTRQCTANCYGPWSASRGVPCFVRISFFFPSRYPEQAPRFELEHNASVPLKTYASLLRSITLILESCAEEKKASMKPCMIFLSGQDQERVSSKGAVEHIDAEQKGKLHKSEDILENPSIPSKSSTPIVEPLPPTLIRRISASPTIPKSEAEITLLPLTVPSSFADDSQEVTGLPQSIAASQNTGAEDVVSDDGSLYGQDYEIDENGIVHAYRLQDSESDEVNSDEESANGDENNELISNSSTTAETVLDTLIWTIPFGFLYLMLDILIQQQYAIQPNLFEQFLRLINTLPILAIFIYATAVRGTNLMPRVVLQLIFLALGTATGCGFLYIYMRSAQGIVVRRTAPLGTLWIYCTAKMDLSLTVVSLAIIYGFVVHHNLDLFS